MQTKRRLRVPSPAFVISVVALFVALGGTAFAAGTSLHKDQKADTKLVKKLAPSLSVKQAKTAASATHATSADSATNATHATSADSASNAANASTLSGFAANALARLAHAEVDDNIVLNNLAQVLATVSITAPAAGFVLVESDYSTFGSGCPCEASYELESDTNALSILRGTRVETAGFDQGGSLSYVFPVAAGVRKFHLLGFETQGATVSAGAPSLQAVYVPFGASG